VSAGKVFSLGERDALARRHAVVWRKGDGFEFSSHLDLSTWSESEKLEFANNYVTGYAWGDQKTVNLVSSESLLDALRAEPEPAHPMVQS
jgi:hypothetical protein